MLSPFSILCSLILQLHLHLKVQSLILLHLLHHVLKHKWVKVGFNMIPLLDHHLCDMSIIWRTKDIPWKSLVESTIKHLLESLWRWRAAHSIRYMSRTPMPIVRMVHRKQGHPTSTFGKSCSEDDLGSRIFVTFVVKFIACLPLLGFSNI